MKSPAKQVIAKLRESEKRSAGSSSTPPGGVVFDATEMAHLAAILGYFGKEYAPSGAVSTGMFQLRQKVRAWEESK